MFELESYVAVTAVLEFCSRPRDAIFRVFGSCSSDFGRSVAGACRELRDCGNYWVLVFGFVYCF